MAKKAAEFKVGIVVLIGAAMFLAVFLFLQGYQISRTFNKVRVAFSDVGGLKKGDPVSVSGVTLGKVEDVSLNKDVVITRLSIDGEAFLHSDATFTIKNYGLMGERFVYVDPGKSGNPLDFSQVQAGLTDAGTSELIGLFGQTIRDVQQILSDIRNTIASQSNLQNLTELASTLTDLSKKLSQFFLDNRGSIKQTFTNIESATSRLDAFIDTTSHKIDTTLNNFADASVSLNRLADSLEMVTQTISEFLRKVEDGEGTLGLLSQDETLYQDIKKMVRSVESIIEDIRRDPKKYLKIEMKLF